MSVISVNQFITANHPPSMHDKDHYKMYLPFAFSTVLINKMRKFGKDDYF